MTPVNYQARTLSGVVERFRFRAKDSGWAVMILRGEDQQWHVAQGVVPAIQPGDRVVLNGRWIDTPKHGRQFKVETYTLQFGDQGLFRFLCELEQIGPKRARAIMDRFGDDVLDVVQNAPEKLLAIPGITPERVSLIHATYRTAAENQEALLFLQSLSLSPGQLTRLLEAYDGADLRKKIAKNPYQLIGTAGVTFRVAEGLALRLGLPPTSPSRIQAGCHYTIQVVQRTGHSYALYAAFMADVSQLLQIEPDLVAAQVPSCALILEGDRVYGPALYHAEYDVARGLRRLRAQYKAWAWEV